MRNFDAIAALRGEGLRPELRALLERTVAERGAKLFVRSDGMLQSGPDVTPTASRRNVVPLVGREPVARTNDKRETMKTSTG